MKSQYKRVLIKLSGEAFKGNREYGIDPEFLVFIANEIKEGVSLGCELSFVIGGGNIFRGEAAAAKGMDRVTADHSGMIATVMNALALKDALQKVGVESRVQTALEMKQIAEPFILKRAIRHMQKDRVVIFAGGTGNPYFTTDTAAVLRAAEINADLIMKATKVDGIYTADPMKDKSATKFTSITHIDALKSNLKIMDSTAFSLSMDNNLPIVVFSLFEKGNIKRILSGEKIGSFVGEK